jgi:hypothetical protein
MPDYDLTEEVRLAKGNLGQEGEGLTDLQLLVAGQDDSRIVADALTVNTFKDAVNARGPGNMTALMYAAKGLKGDIAEKLVAAGADKALTNGVGETALQIFDKAQAADQVITKKNGESPTIPPSILQEVRKTFEGGRRRRKTRARQPRKTKRRQTRRRR